jgi:hypothetical protein
MGFLKERRIIVRLGRIAAKGHAESKKHMRMVKSGMKMRSLHGWPGRKVPRCMTGHSIIETLVAMTGLSIVAVAIFCGIGSGMLAVSMARENSRATQILLEKVETIRLYNWDQLSLSGFIPSTFTAPYDPQSTSGSLLYHGTFTINPALLNTSYSNDLKLITVNVSWKSGEVLRQRQMSTYFSRYGLQSYIY